MKRALALGFTVLVAGCSSHSPASQGAGGNGGSGGAGGGVGGVGGSGGSGGGSHDAGGSGGSDGGNVEGGGGGSDGGSGNHPSSYPIDHIIVMVKENHTFDNYFGGFPNAESTMFAQTSKGPVPLMHAPNPLTRDPCHSHECALADWNHGAMDHWDIGDPANATDKLAFSQYYETDIPNYWQYARHFGLADHFHSSMLGQSFAGHMFFLAAQSGWALNNPTGGFIFWGCDQTSSVQPVQDQVSCTTKSVKPCYSFPTVVDNLPSGVTWKFYGSALPPVVGEVWSLFDAVDKIRNGPGWKNVVPDPNFDSDVDNGTLPNISFLVDQDTNSEHPPFRICDGENWTVAHLNHVMKSPLWNHVAILMSWDDFGGWYDHVPPPKQYGCDAQAPYGLGFRLPLIIVSPYVKQGSVYHNVSHQASIPKFIETVFNLPSMQSQDPAAQDGPGTDDLTAAFDWKQAPIAPLPLVARDCTNQR